MRTAYQIFAGLCYRYNYVIRVNSIVRTSEEIYVIIALLGIVSQAHVLKAC